MEIGQEIFIEPTNNAARYNKEVKKCRISKIGKKYFEVEEMNGTRFFIKDLKHDAGQYTSNYNCYLTLQEIKDKKEAQAIFDNVKKVFSGWKNKLSLSQLKEIDRIINCA